MLLRRELLETTACNCVLMASTSSCFHTHFASYNLISSIARLTVFGKAQPYDPVILIDAVYIF